MEDKVYVRIRTATTQVFAQGVQEADDVIEVIHPAIYAVVDEKECIQYDEYLDGSAEVEKSANLIKIGSEGVEVIKEGAVNTHIDFRKDKKTMSLYETPFGNISLGIFTDRLHIERLDDKIRIDIDYSMDINYQQVSDCSVEIEITNRGAIGL